MRKQVVFQNSYQASKTPNLKISQKYCYLLVLLYYIVVRIVICFFSLIELTQYFAYFLTMLSTLWGGFAHETMSQCEAP